MTTPAAPARRPANPNFSSGPTSKRPGWTLDALSGALIGRSHRSRPGKAKLKRAIELTREVLRVPADYRIGIVPASDTGAVEMALWTMIGARGVDVLAWEAFSDHWVTDIVEQLEVPGARVFRADYGKLPDLAAVDFANDVVFPWNGTTSGVRVPDGDWIPDDRQGLTICDATSGLFAQDIPLAKLDVTTFSWQKVMGSEAAHGMLILSPRAVKRIETYTPPRPLPKIFRLASRGKILDEIFEGDTINTPSMIAVEDYLDSLAWAKAIGGLPALRARADANAEVMSDWVERTGWVDFLCRDPALRSNTSICLEIVDPDLDKAHAATVARAIAARLDKEGVAYDIGSYRDAPPGMRVWAGSTVEASDLAILTEWLDWAFAVEKAAVMLTA